MQSNIMVAMIMITDNYNMTHVLSLDILYNGDCVYDLISLVTRGSSNVLPGTREISPGVIGGLEFPDVRVLFN